MAASASDLAAVAAFWREAGAKAWFRSDPLFDAEIAIRFEAQTRAAARALEAGPHPGEAGAEGALALCILVDQFPRNIYRGLTLSWAFDPLALGVARRAVAAGLDREIADSARQFLYMPFMHAEDAEAQAEGVRLFAAWPQGGGNLDHARAHARIIEKFGRFPTRNAVLGRAMTPGERAWMAAGGYGKELRDAGG